MCGMTAYRTNRYSACTTVNFHLLTFVFHAGRVFTVATGNSYHLFGNLFRWYLLMRASGFQGKVEFGTFRAVKFCAFSTNFDWLSMVFSVIRTGTNDIFRSLISGLNVSSFISCTQSLITYIGVEEKVLWKPLSQIWRDADWYSADRTVKFASVCHVGRWNDTIETLRHFRQRVCRPRAAFYGSVNGPRNIVHSNRESIVAVDADITQSLTSK